jgi:hypothetical protein
MVWEVQDVQRLSSRCQATEFKMYSDRVQDVQRLFCSVMEDHSNIDIMQPFRNRVAARMNQNNSCSVEIDEMTLISFTETPTLLSQRYLYTVLKVIRWSRAIKSQKLKR